MPKVPEKPKYSLDQDGEFDEVWFKDANVHIERMNETGFWIGIEAPGMPRVHVNTGVYRGEWYFNVHDEEIGGQSFEVRRPRNSKRKLPFKKSGNMR